MEVTESYGKSWLFLHVLLVLCISMSNMSSLTLLLAIGSMLGTFPMGSLITVCGCVCVYMFVGWLCTSQQSCVYMTVMWTGMPHEWPLQESGAACIVKHMVTFQKTHGHT